MKAVLILLLILVSNLSAGEKSQSMQKFSSESLIEKSENTNLSFNQEKYQLIQEIKLQTQQESEEEAQKKSGLKAAMLSALVPGAGEYYAESYWKSALFALIEIGAWSAYFTYENKGDDKDLEMRRFGDESWSEQRYWTKVYKLAIDKGNLNEDPNLYEQGTQLVDMSNEAFIETLRQQESGGNLNKHFSHTLPRTKTQQYYEMIYKYPSQFGAGWIEVGEMWTYYDNSANQDNLLPDIAKYKRLRNTSNDYYATATNMATVVLLNHLASAIDAAFTVKTYNAELKYSFYAGQRQYAGERVNTYGLALSW
ncbi:MAG: hypothetical protein D8M58_19350 [Calditrichaeota bacterium]|nr:MAG: hypothetical protein DWQ03_22030 [Calditrichota bacterium]MBL1207569.1 hypothetical protein [Calditrichota bacterium]NOG47401.1 hypothetical protein [Calditrichota bacterium]